MEDTRVVNPSAVQHPKLSLNKGNLDPPKESNSLAHNTPKPSLGRSQAHSLLTTSACMHGRTSHTRTQHKQATTQVHKRLKSAHDATQDVKGNVYVQLTWTASSRKEEHVAAYGITNGGENSAMGSSKAREWRRLFSAKNRVPQKVPPPFSLGHILPNCTLVVSH